jgi:hypothetical protein
LGFSGGDEIPSGLAPLSQRTWCVVEAKFGCAAMTKPNQNVWSIRPEEGTDFSGHLHGFIDAQSLQSLNVKRPIVKIALGAFVSVNTLPLAKHLFTH